MSLILEIMNPAIPFTYGGWVTQCADSTIENALSACNQFGLTQVEAIEEVKSVCHAVNSWQKHFIQMGITGQDLAQLSAQIDRPFLKLQRQAWV